MDTNYKTIKILADMTNYTTVINWVVEQCKQTELSTSAMTKLQLAVEEIFVNIASYAYPPKEGDVEISYYLDKKINQIEMNFIDKGKPYNPLTEAKQPDITLSAEERPVGGLGLFLVRNTMDYVNYEYSDGKNIFTIKMNIDTTNNG